MASWGAILGERIAAVATPQRIENGILYVTVSSAPWRTELAMQRREIAARLNAAAGKELVKDVRFR
jgi:predicted nucleic acid-binding Zn ribbon protein